VGTAASYTGGGGKWNDLIKIVGNIWKSIERIKAAVVLDLGAVKYVTREGKAERTNATCVHSITAGPCCSQKWHNANNPFMAPPTQDFFLKLYSRVAANNQRFVSFAVIFRGFGSPIKAQRS
jgi:hypothetical protein